MPLQALFQVGLLFELVWNYQNQNAIRDRGSTALFAVYIVDTADTFDTAYTVDMIYTVDTGDTVYTVNTFQNA